MSRTVPPDLTKRLKEATENPPGPITITIPLKTITPVVGGGVESMTPDTVDHVRVQGIRGQLRWWWRALHPYKEPKDLFEHETRIWGGVGKSDIKDGNSKNKKTVDATKSLVALEAKIDTDPSHKETPFVDLVSNKSKTIKSTEEYDAESYTLFPLRLGDDKPDKSDKPTSTGLEFSLKVTLSEKTTETDKKDIFAALSLWCLFASIGARGNRGFGRIALKGDIKYSACADTNQIAESFLNILSDDNGSNEPALKAFKKFRSLVLSLFTQEQNTKEPFGGFSSFQIALKRVLNKPSHEFKPLVELIKKYKSFRQMRGDDQELNKFGKTMWPEPDMARNHGKGVFRPKLTPNPSFVDGAPRAAFGLPIALKFKPGSPQESCFDGTFQLSKSQRFTSPLRFGTTYIKGQLFKFAIDTGERPEDCIFIPDQEEKLETISVDWKSQDGKHDIKDRLKKSKGDAVHAFFNFLTEESGWTLIGPGGSHDV